MRILLVSFLLLLPLWASAQTVTLQVIEGAATEAGPVSAVLRFERTGATTSALKVFVTRLAFSTASNADFSDNNGSFFKQLNQVTIPTGESAFDLEISPTPDNLVEPLETLETQLASGSYTIGTIDPVSITIADDPPIVTLNASAMNPNNLNAAENGALAQMDVSRTGGNLAATLRVNFVIDPASTAVGADFSDNNGSFFESLDQVTIAANQSVFTLELTATPDNLVEGPETLDINLAAGSYQIGGPNQALVTITDDAPVISLIAIKLTTAEGGSPALIRFSRSGGGMAALRVNTVIELTSTASGSDYSDNNGSFFESLNFVTIAAGETAFDLQITAVQDGLEEGTEMLDFSLADGSYLQTGLTSVSIEILDVLIFSDGFE